MSSTCCSGFLITSLLVRELERTGTIRLRNFWARRARRLLPASCLVIVATLIGGYYTLSPLAQQDLAHDALAAATFVVNIVFAHRQSDYLTAQAAPSPLLNYWSLALEEQFYLIWPVLIVLVAAGRRHVRAMIGGLVAVIWPISLVACIYLTVHSQPWAFFSLPTRAWELLTGAALALGAARVARLPGALRAVVGWAGLAGVVIAGVMFSDTTEFPGVAAMLPVLATAAIVAAGTTLLTGPASILRWSPLQWVGRRSYAIYLWHWPALVLVDAKWGPLRPWQRGLVVLAVGGRRRHLLLGHRGPRAALALAGGARLAGPGARRQPHRDRGGDLDGRVERHPGPDRYGRGGGRCGHRPDHRACHRRAHRRHDAGHHSTRHADDHHRGRPAGRAGPHRDPAARVGQRRPAHPERTHDPGAREPPAVCRQGERRPADDLQQRLPPRRRCHQAARLRLR